MKISKSVNDSVLNITVEGRLDTTTAPDMESEISGVFDGINQVNLDFAALEYISSAGLRIILGMQKQMNKQGGAMTVKNVSPEIMEIFDVTGFSDILTIE